MSNGVIRRILKYTSKQKRIVILLALSALIYGTLDVISPYFLGKAIDGMASGAVDFVRVLKIVSMLGIFLVFSASTSYFVGYLAAKTTATVIAELRKDLFAAINRLPLSFFDTNSRGDVINRFTNDADAVSDGLLQGTLQLFIGAVMIVGTLTAMLCISWIVTLAVIAVTSVTFLTASFVSRISHKYFKRQQELAGELNGIAEEYIGGAKTVKAFGYERKSQEKFDGVNERLYTVGQKAQFTSSLTNPTTRFVNNLAYIAVGLIGGAFAGLTAGKISSFIVYSVLFAKPFNEITGVATQIMTAFASLRRIFETMDTVPEKPDAPNAQTLKVSSGDIKFDHVAFSYAPGKRLITDFSAEAQKGRSIAIVGPTGAGKTTLINLIMRFYEADSGNILIDGHSIYDITRESLRAGFGMVLQEAYIFYGSVRDNIAYGKQDASLEEIIEAAKFAHAHTFIEKLPNGYDTIITADGDNISEGEKQLLSIARVILMNPSMLILDEATSSVDSLTELQISDAFAKMMKNRLSFIIAHRLSTIKRADLILVMNNGDIIEQGTHDNLLEKDGFYARMYNSQFE